MTSCAEISQSLHLPQHGQVRGIQSSPFPLFSLRSLSLSRSLSWRALAGILAESKPSLPSVKGTDATAAPVYRCTLSVPRRGVVIPHCEVMLDSGHLRCDLYLPVREIVKLRLEPSDITRQAKPIDSKAITFRQFEQVEITMVFADADGKEFPRKALLDVFGNDDHYQSLKEKAAAAEKTPVSEPATESSSPSYESPQLRGAVQPPVNQLTPIKHLAGTGRERVILGKSGAFKLDLEWDAKKISDYYDFILVVIDQSLRWVTSSLRLPMSPRREDSDVVDGEGVEAAWMTSIHHQRPRPPLHRQRGAVGGVED